MARAKKNTNTITNIDRAALRELRDAVMEAVADVEAKYGISIKPGAATYGGANGTIKLELAVKSESGEVVSREAEDYKRYHSMFGLPAGALGQVVTHNGEKYKVGGLLTRSHKYPVLMIQVATGKQFKWATELLNRVLPTAKKMRKAA